MQTQAKRSERSQTRFSARLCTQILCLALLIAACSSPSSTQTAALATPVVQSKLLATLFISPTPKQQEQDATRLAIHASTPTPAPTDTLEPTAYIGVFVGDAQGVDGGVPSRTRQAVWPY